MAGAKFSTFYFSNYSQTNKLMQCIPAVTRNLTPNVVLNAKTV